MTAHYIPGLFEGYGLELEYMIVHPDSLDVLPVADLLLKQAAGKMTNEFDAGIIGWSNEFALHVIEFKTNGPVTSLVKLEEAFQAEVARANEYLSDAGGRLMPTAMHPWMDPGVETRLWPHQNRAIYNTYNRIFNGQGHGWSNIQSTHLNLAFRTDDEFHRLHSAIRILLPLLAALGASSPVVERRVTGYLDSRLTYYAGNQRKIPSIAGQIIPEAVSSMKEYRKRILTPMYADIAPYDPDGVLQEEWLNSRGAIARFDRMAIEIRVLDVQECPLADVAIAAAIVEAIRVLARERWAAIGSQSDFPVERLLGIYQSTMRHAEESVIEDPQYLALFGLGESRLSAGELWHHILEHSRFYNLGDPALAQAMKTILGLGPLARRMTRALGQDPSSSRLFEVYQTLCGCLASGVLFRD